MSNWSLKIKRYRELCHNHEAHLVSATRDEFLALFEELKALDITGVLLDEIQALQKENRELKELVHDLYYHPEYAGNKPRVDRLLGGEK